MKNTLKFCLSLFAAFTFLSCSSQENKCDLLKKEELVVDERLEKSISTLLQCGFDTLDIQVLAPFVSKMIVDNVKSGKRLTFGDIIAESERLKARSDYQQIRAEQVAHNEERRKKALAKPLKLDFSILCSIPTEAGRYNDFKEVPHYYNYEDALDCAKKQGKTVMVYFTGHSAVTCRKFEMHVLSDPEVQGILKDKVILAALYVDDHTDGEKNRKLQEQKFKSEGQPSIFLMTNKGEILTKSIGFSHDDYFLNKLKEVVW